jgi:putative transposase
MPDHWHAIFYPGFPLTIARVMECIKVGSTRRINAARGESGLLWQRRYFDRALRTVKEYGETVTYIHQNPVRAGLVERAEDWPWSSVGIQRNAAITRARPSGLTDQQSITSGSRSEPGFDEKPQSF